MQRRYAAMVIATVGCLVPGCDAAKPESPAASPAQIAGEAYRLEPAYLISVHLPNADVEKVLAAAVAAVGLDYGKYDQVAYLATRQSLRGRADDSSREQNRRSGVPSDRRSTGSHPHQTAT